MPLKFVFVPSVIALAVLLASLSPAHAHKRYTRCADGACNLHPSKIVDSTRTVRHRRVVHHTRVIPRTHVVNHNRLILHRRTVHHDHLTVHKHRIVQKLIVAHRYNTFHRRAVVHRHHFRDHHLYYPVRVVEHRYMQGYNRWCGCGR